MACLRAKLNFLANGCVLGQNARKETLSKIQFYCQDIINLLFALFLKLINGIGLFFCLISTLYACLLVICSQIFKLLYNSLNFEAKINLNTTRPNDLKWRKTCIGLKFYLEHFYGLQTKFIRDSLYKHPVLIVAKAKVGKSHYHCKYWKIGSNITGIFLGPK